MTIEALKSELSKLTPNERRRILTFLQDLDGPSEEEATRLQESIQDYVAGRTTASEVVHKELNARIAKH